MPGTPEKHESYITMTKIGLDAYMHGMLSLGVRWQNGYKEPTPHFDTYEYYRQPNHNKVKGPIDSSGYYNDGNVYVLTTEQDGTEIPESSQFRTLFHECGHAGLDLPVPVKSLTLFGKSVNRNGYKLHVGTGKGRDYLVGFNEAMAEKLGEYFYTRLQTTGTSLPKDCQDIRFGINHIDSRKKKKASAYPGYFAFWDFFVNRLAEKNNIDFATASHNVLHESIRQEVPWIQHLEKNFGTHALSMLALMGADLHPSGFDSEPLATKEYRTWYITKFFSSDQTLRQSYPLEQFPDLQTPDQIRTYLVQQALKDIPDHIVDELLNEVPAMIKVMFSKDPVTHYLYSPYPKEQTPRRRGRIETMVRNWFAKQ